MQVVEYWKRLKLFICFSLKSSKGTTTCLNIVSSTLATSKNPYPAVILVTLGGQLRNLDYYG